ncbi:MAG: photosynthetic complex putative assembly protein PuhB [Chromatiaceae bacterium]|jgi:hypothetical protein
MIKGEPEALWGLPEDLPDGEHMVWQGQPAWREMAVRVFHIRKVAIYFVLLAVIHVGFQLYEGATWLVAAKGASWLILLGLSAMLVLGVLAKLYANSTIYTITNHRVVLRFGVALPMMINIPWDKVDAADLQMHGKDHGSIALSVSPDQKMSYWLLWPFAKPWRFSPVQPMLRCIAEPEDVAGKLRQAVSAHTGSEVTALPRAASTSSALPTATKPRSAAYS